MRLIICWVSFLVFHPLIAHSALEDIPAVLKSEIQPPNIEAKSWVVTDFETGWVLASKNVNQRIDPASLTKLMTSYLVFDALRKNEITMQDKVHISEKAWRTGGSKMFIEVNTQVSVLDLVQGLIIQSGNDASVALAEHISGSEVSFASKMNAMALELGMSDSHFVNSSGLPADNHYSTAADMTLLAMALIRRFPKLYRYYSQDEFTYNNITQQNRNILLARDPTVDGIKTGYTKNAGYCLIGTALRDGTRLMATVYRLEWQSHARKSGAIIIAIRVWCLPRSNHLQTGCRSNVIAIVDGTNVNREYRCRKKSERYFSHRHIG